MLPPTVPVESVKAQLAPLLSLLADNNGLTTVSSQHN